MEALKHLPIGIQDFEKLRLGAYLYVDKTKWVYQLVTSGCYYFLSRPRRFGKSLLMSTLHAYFEGRKELFEGLAIAELEKNWIKYPVLHLDLNLTDYKSDDSLDKILNDNLSKWESLYGAEVTEATFALRFAGIINRAYTKTGRRVVILVDEYDKPILQAIGNEELQDNYRSTLKSFYGVLKTMDGCIQFALLTGVTKFGKISVFSDLNNLCDISMYSDYVPLCGMTDEEIDTTLMPYLQRLSDAIQRPVDEVRAELRERYDGYHFEEDSIAIYNPFSVLNALQQKKFKSFWFETGTPSYLVYLLKKHGYKLADMEGYEVEDDALNCVDSSSTDPIPMIYQSGYLTIKGYNPRFGLYKLGFPNKEVEDGFMKYLLPHYTSIQQSQTGFYIANFIDDITAGRVDAFMERLKSMLAGVEYDLILNVEKHYQNVIYIVCKLMGFYVKAESKTSDGRIDMLLATNNRIYVFEFKLDGSADEALQQIDDKDYAQQFKFAGKKVVKVGINISSKTRNIEGWKVEE